MKKTICQLMSLCRLRKETHCYLISSTQFKKLLQVLGIPAEEEEKLLSGGALGSLGALKPSTHPVILIFLYPLGAAGCALEVDAMRALDLVDAVGALDLLGAAGCALEVDAMRALDLVKAVRALDLLGAAGCALEVDAIRALDLVEAVGALDLVEVEVVGLSLNILILASLSGYLT
ncbi:hypothetical protein Tco_0861959 [Tanacetum coccineum]